MQATSVIPNFQVAKYQKERKRISAEINIDNIFYGIQHLKNTAI